jgi:hypothetical protein
LALILDGSDGTCCNPVNTGFKAWDGLVRFNNFWLTINNKFILLVSKELFVLGLGVVRELVVSKLVTELLIVNSVNFKLFLSEDLHSESVLFNSTV